ncbi:MAG: imidazole glycerol phosphate synthase subunit HisH [Candidatus Omnitrophica bacterium]|nr:imidazole glycerol phosphate synthase subunit HisH [Candidatus Omnitrophota bacterium]
MIVVVDYGMGNLRSVSKALERAGASVRVSDQPKDVARATKLIVPGVGAFDVAMDELRRRKLAEPITQAIASGTPYLGICLGLQLLFEFSEEGNVPGLGVLDGRVKRFTVLPPLKVPHMGWNRVRRLPRAGACPLLAGIPDESFFYFVHSYYADPADRAIVALETEYDHPFASMMWRERVFATQFHPEKSQAAGLKLLENFVTL